MLLFMHNALTVAARRQLSSSGPALLSASAAVASSPSPSSRKSKLAELRKLTGFSFSLCKSALVQHEFDVSRAAQWLNSQAQAEGWARVQKLSNRVASQGLVCVAYQRGSAAMLELRCETDFVARTSVFVSLAQQLATSCLPAARQLEVPDTIRQLQLNELSSDDGVALPDLVAGAVGKLGEKIEMGRAIGARTTSEVHLSTYVHPSQDSVNLQTGRYGAMVLFRVRQPQEGFPAPKRPMPPNKLGRNLCQHVVGMAPLSLGDPLLLPETRLAEEEEEVEQAQTSAETNQEKAAEDQESDAEEEVEVKEVPSTLLDQDYLVEPDITVREYLARHNVDIIEFARMESGE